MKDIIHILILEDSIDDVELIVMILQRANIPTIYTAVSDKAEFEAEIKSGTFDIVISDHNLGQFNCFHAMEICKPYNIPFIVISGMLTSENQTKLKENNIPFMYKDNLKGLPAMIVKMLEQKAGDSIS
jgi:DNA-binding NtrC family response regulator